MKNYKPTLFDKLFELLTSLLPVRLARSARWRRFTWAKRAAEAGLDVEVIGFRWRLHPLDNLTERLLWSYRKHPEEKSLSWALESLRGKKSLIIDIGANCGSFTIPLIACAGTGSHCLAFEPNPIMASRLQTNIAFNALTKLVDVHRVALGDKEGEANLTLSVNLGESTMRTGADSRLGSIRVPVRSLRDYLSGATGYDTIFLKIDVEGYEPEVLLPFFRAAEMKIWPTHILIETEHSDQWSIGLMGELSARGYSTAGAEDGNTLLKLRVD
jgi:FkbM family methyltransferase